MCVGDLVDFVARIGRTTREREISSVGKMLLLDRKQTDWPKEKWHNILAADDNKIVLLGSGGLRLSDHNDTMDSCTASCVMEPHVNPPFFPHLLVLSLFFTRQRILDQFEHIKIPEGIMHDPKEETAAAHLVPDHQD